MSLIINTKLTQLKKGFPTTTDKYTVRGATLNAASADVGNGDLIEYVGDGSFKKASATTTVATLAGVCLRSLTHVVNGLTGTGEVVFKAGDTIDLVVGGSDFSAYLRKLGACLVGNYILGNYRFCYTVLKRSVWKKSQKDLIKRRFKKLVRIYIIEHSSCRGKH